MIFVIAFNNYTIFCTLQYLEKHSFYATKTGRLYKNKMYFTFFDDCTEELKSEYLSKKQLPILKIEKGTKVQQIDIETKNVVETYDSIMDAMKKNGVSRGCIKRSCLTNEAHAGYLWKYL